MNHEELLDLIQPKIIKGHSLSGQLIVTLTSYPARFSILHISLTSLLNQSMRPDKVILWLWEGDYDVLPEKVRNFESQGVEIRLIPEDWQSYKKLIPALREFPDAYLVTADDDAIYKPTWLEELVMSHKLINGIVAHRGHFIQCNADGSIKPYEQWFAEAPKTNYYALNSAFVLPTGMGGVLYPPNCFNSHVLDISLAFQLCPTADDIWFYFMHLLNNQRASLIGGKSAMEINPQDENALWHINKITNDYQFTAMINKFGFPEELEVEIQSSSNAVDNHNAILLRNGQTLVTQKNHRGKTIRKTRFFYEKNLINYVTRHFAPKSVIDVGSNIGNYAVGFSGKEGYKVLCFEPDKELADITMVNLINNNIDCEVFNFGLGRSEECRSHVKSIDNNSGLAKENEKEECDRKTLGRILDDCIEPDFSPDLIKIDVNGFELDVLIGAKKTLKRHLPILISAHQTYERYKECMNFLEEFNYKPIKVFGATPIFIYVNKSKYEFSMTDEKSNWVDGWRKFAFS